MKIKLFSLFRDLHHSREKNIFKRTQRQLTTGFIKQLMLFLFLFIVVMFAVLYIVIIQVQERDIQSFASEEAIMIEKYLLRDKLRPDEKHEEHEPVSPEIEQFFYYVVSSSGELLLGKEDLPQLQSQLLSIVKDGNNKDKDTFQAKVDIDLSNIGESGSDEYELQLNPSQHNIHLMIAKEPVLTSDHEVGTLYIGKDISFVYQLFTWFWMVLLGLTVIFFGVALYMSNRMSKKAMVPISNAFDRQREFVADASHELRTPLSVILSSIDAVEMTIDGSKDDMVHKFLFNIKDEAKRMTNLVGDLLTLARSDSGKIEQNNDVFDFTPVAKKAMDSIKPLAEEKQIGLQFDAPESIIGKGDLQRLTQLLYILLDNAIKYTPNGGEVGLTLSVKQNELCIKVRDTGMGIHPEEQEFIFERFYRSDKARSRQMGSYGLGLSIAKWIVDIHHGSIQVASEVGKGSTFTIQIPFYINNPEKV